MHRRQRKPDSSYAWMATAMYKRWPGFAWSRSTNPPDDCIFPPRYLWDETEHLPLQDRKTDCLKYKYLRLPNHLWLVQIYGQSVDLILSLGKAHGIVKEDRFSLREGESSMQQSVVHWWRKLGYPAFEPGEQG